MAAAREVVRTRRGSRETRAVRRRRAARTARRSRSEVSLSASTARSARFCSSRIENTVLDANPAADDVFKRRDASASSFHAPPSPPSKTPHASRLEIDILILGLGVAVAVAVAVGVGRGELALDAPANVTKELGASAIAMQKKRRDGDAGRRRLLPGGGGGSEGISEKKYRPAVRSGGWVGAVEVLTWPPCTRWPSPRGQS